MEAYLCEREIFRALSKISRDSSTFSRDAARRQMESVQMRALNNYETVAKGDDADQLG